MLIEKVNSAMNSRNKIIEKVNCKCQLKNVVLWPLKM